MRKIAKKMLILSIGSFFLTNCNPDGTAIQAIKLQKTNLVITVGNTNCEAFLDTSSVKYTTEIQIERGANAPTGALNCFIGGQYKLLDQNSSTIDGNIEIKESNHGFALGDVECRYVNLNPPPNNFITITLPANSGATAKITCSKTATDPTQECQEGPFSLIAAINCLDARLIPGVLVPICYNLGYDLQDRCPPNNNYLYFLRS